VNFRKRLEKLTTKISPNREDGFTLEELARMLWRKNRPGFLARAEGELKFLGQFVSRFEREDAERLARAQQKAVAR
jgi:hypothetical protein